MKFYRKDGTYFTGHGECFHCNKKLKPGEGSHYILCSILECAKNRKKGFPFEEIWRW